MRTLSDVHERDKARRISRMPAGPARLGALLRYTIKDAERLPLQIDGLPSEVQSAYQAFESAVETARDAITGHSDSTAAVNEAAEQDVKGFLASLRENKALPKLKRLGARAKVEESHVSLEACEKLLGVTHDELVDAMREVWADWRRDLLSQSEASREAAADAVGAADRAIKKASGEYQAILSLDHEIVGRCRDIGRQVEEEQRAGTPWYQLTHFPTEQPLRRLVIVDEKHGGTISLDMEAVLAALRAALEPQAFGASEWVPPDDAEHATLQASEWTSAPWLVKAMRRVIGPHCAICGNGRPAADFVAHEDGKAVLVHESCLHLSAAQQDKLERQRARAKMAQGARY